MKSYFKNTRFLVTTAMLAAIASVLMVLDFPLPFLPSFYKIDFSEFPVIIGAYAMGPVAGVIIELIKILVNFLLNGSSTAGIGELANFLVGVSFVLPASLIYQLKKTKVRALIGLCVGVVCCTVVGCLLNAYVLLPAYAAAFGGMENIIKAGTKVNDGITGLGSFILLATAPLNLIKSVAVSIITMLVYKPLSRLIKGTSDK